MSEHKRFQGWFKTAREKGLADIKFFVKDGITLSDEQFFKSANAITDKMAAGEQRPAARLMHEAQSKSSLFA